MKCQKCGAEFTGNFCPNCGTQAGATYQTKFCKFCGEKIPFDAVVCTKCGRQVEQVQSNQQPLVINNSASASAVNTGKRRKHYSLLLDLILLVCTGGLWLIWMILRPKYE